MSSLYRRLIPPVPLKDGGTRPRYAFNRNEAAGALGDLGTFLPHILGAIAVAGLAPTGVLVSFGLFYLASGAFYGLPIGVQPMKAASAAVLIQRLTPGEIAGAGLVIGTFFLVAGLTGLVERLSRLTPKSVIAGIQLGLGLSLAILGVRLMEKQPLIGLIVAGAMLLTLENRRFPAALVGLILGLALGFLADPGRVLSLSLGLHLPHLALPTWEETLRGTELAVLPQIPLTLTNAIIVTAALSTELFPKEVSRATERNLALSTGLGNLIFAPLGGYMMCHGAGGLAGHYRFGARTATAPLLIGLTFLALGLLLGDDATAVMQLLPEAVLGALLFFSGLELAGAARVQTYSDETPVVLCVAAISVATNPALAFLVGLPLAYARQRGWIRI